MPTAGDGLWKAYFDHADEIHREIDPEDPPMPREKRRAMLISAQSVPYMNRYHYLLLAGDGEAAGSVSASAENAKSPSYESNKHMGRLNISVLSNYRRKGLGSRLLKHLTGELAVREPAVTEFLAPVILGSGLGFFDRLGGTVSLMQSENRLYLKDLDWGMVEAWAAEGKSKNPSTTFIKTAVIAEEDINDFSGIYSETMNQQPFGDISLKIKITPAQIRLGEKRNQADGVEHTTIYTRESDGRVSGLTETAYLKEAGHKVTQLLTGVKACCRGRGLGKTLKALMLLDIREKHPDVKYMVTGNADSNAPMVAINHKLGFKKRLPVLLYKLKIQPGT